MKQNDRTLSMHLKICSNVSDVARFQIFVWSFANSSARPTPIRKQYRAGQRSWHKRVSTFYNMILTAASRAMYGTSSQKIHPTDMDIMLLTLKTCAESHY